MKYSRADCSCSSDSAQDWTQETTRFANCEDGQKHLVSLLEVHFGSRLSQVFRHLGTRLGQEAD